MKTQLIILIVFIFSAFALKANDEILARVTAVIDGNTIEIESENNGRQRVLFIGIDCPELDQEFGEYAKKFVEKLLLNKKIKVVFKGKDRVGNHLAIVLINDDDVRIELLKEGLAWTAEKNPAEDLEPYRSWAQQKSRGLWKQSNPTPPWVFRRQQSMSQPKSS